MPKVRGHTVSLDGPHPLGVCWFAVICWRVVVTIGSVRSVGGFALERGHALAVGSTGFRAKPWAWRCRCDCGVLMMVGLPGVDTHVVSQSGWISMSLNHFSRCGSYPGTRREAVHGLHRRTPPIPGASVGLTRQLRAAPAPPLAAQSAVTRSNRRVSASWPGTAALHRCNAQQQRCRTDGPSVYRRASSYACGVHRQWHRLRSRHTTCRVVRTCTSTGPTASPNERVVSIANPLDRVSAVGFSSTIRYETVSSQIIHRALSRPLDIRATGFADMIRQSRCFGLPDRMYEPFGLPAVRLG